MEKKHCNTFFSIGKLLTRRIKLLGGSNLFLTQLVGKFLNRLLFTNNNFHDKCQNVDRCYLPGNHQNRDILTIVD